MANHRVGETGLSDSGPSNHHSHLSYAVLQGIPNPSSASIFHQERSSFNFGELEEAMVLQTDGAKSSFLSGRPGATLKMFPFSPIRFHQTEAGSSKSGEESTESGSAVNSLHSKAEEAQLEQSESSMSRKKQSSSDHNRLLQPDDDQSIAKLTQEKRKGGGGSTSEKHLDAKTLRRLAQNREAARKSRLRKKAYVQQLETSRIKLTQIEQDIQRSHSQGFLFGAAGGNTSSGAAVFDTEYARWLDDDHRHMAELRMGLHAQLSDADLRIVVDGYIAHYDDLFRLKEVAAKSDVFHLITGLWMSPAERCFLWMGGFRPSELIKMLISQLDPITEQQVMGICKLQHSSQQAEEALTQGLEQLHQSLIDTISSGPIIDGMNQMIVAIGKLANLEGFVCQADILRQQTLHQLRRILTIRQAARCFLVIGEYYARLRALSSLWSSRPRETLINDNNSCQTSTELHMIHPPPNHFTNF